MSIEKRFMKYEYVVGRILSSEKFDFLYKSFKKDKSKETYDNLKCYLDRKSKKYNVELFLTDSDNKLIYNSDKVNTFDRYVEGKIEPSNIYMEQTYENSNKIGSCNTYSKVTDKKSTIHIYLAKKFNSSLGAGETLSCSSLNFTCGKKHSPVN